MKIRNNHNRPLSDFFEKIEILKSNGFNPIGVSQLYFEDVFIFNDIDEANSAYKFFELGRNNDSGHRFSGWWYSKEDFLKVARDYEKTYNDYNIEKTKVYIHWLEN